MKLHTTINGNGLIFSAHKCQRPKFKSHRGRTWDTLMSLVIDGKEHDCYIDTSWGSSYYVQIDNQWYRIPVYQDVEFGTEKKKGFSIDLGYKRQADIVNR